MSWLEVAFRLGGRPRWELNSLTDWQGEWGRCGRSGWVTYLGTSGPYDLWGREVPDGLQTGEIILFLVEEGRVVGAWSALYGDRGFWGLPEGDSPSSTARGHGEQIREAASRYELLTPKEREERSYVIY